MEDYSFNMLSSLEKTSDENVYKASPQTETFSNRKKNIRKVRWTAEEDECLINAVNELGTNCWAHVATRVPGRTGKQCREHYVLTIDPSFSRKAFTKDDDNKIIQLQKLYCNLWAKISVELGRAPTAVKNRFKLIKQREDTYTNPIRNTDGKESQKEEVLNIKKSKDESIDLWNFEEFDPDSLFDVLEEYIF